MGGLRQKQIGGLRFRRQPPINRFIVDFYCAEAGLVIEVDGAVHNEVGHAEYDEDRLVMRETDGVVEVIVEMLG